MKTTAALVFLLLVGSVATTQDRPTITAQPNTVFVGADGKFEANPDTAVMQFNISAQKATSREAYERASKAAEQVRQILRSNGIEPKSAEIGYFSLQPVYDYKTALADIKAGKKINYDGASGNMDYNQFHNVFGPYQLVKANLSGVEQVVGTVSAAALEKGTPKGM